MKKQTLMFMIAAGLTAVMVTGCFGKKAAPQAADGATTAAVVESSAAQDAGSDQKDSAGADKKDGAGADQKDGADKESKEGSAADESNAAAESGAADESSAAAQEGNTALLKSAASAIEKQISGTWGNYGKADVNVNAARNLVIVTLHRDGLTDETLRAMSEEEWRELSGKVQDLAAQYKSTADKLGLKNVHVGVELVDSVSSSKDYLKIVDGNVDYDVWAQLAREHEAEAAAAAQKALEEASAAAETVFSGEVGPGVGLSTADGQLSSRLSGAAAETAEAAGPGTN